MVGLATFGRQVTDIMCALESVTYLSLVAFQSFLKSDNLFLKCPFPCGNRRFGEIGIIIHFWWPTKRRVQLRC